MYIYIYNVHIHIHICVYRAHFQQLRLVRPAHVVFLTWFEPQPDTFATTKCDPTLASLVCALLESNLKLWLVFLISAWLTLYLLFRKFEFAARPMRKTLIVNAAQTSAGLRPKTGPVLHTQSHTNTHTQLCCSHPIVEWPLELGVGLLLILLTFSRFTQTFLCLCGLDFCMCIYIYIHVCVYVCIHHG